MQTTKVKKTPIGQKVELTGLSAPELSRIYGSDGPVMYWLNQLDEHRRTNKDLALGIPKQYLDFTVNLYLSTHLSSSKLIEDLREGLPGNQVKLIPTAPNHPSRKFRVIQLWDQNHRTVNADGNPRNDTVLTRFINQDGRRSSRRRWPAHRPTPLKVDLVEEARLLEEAFLKLREEVRVFRAGRYEWENGNDGLDPKPEETMEAYIKRVRPILHQNWTVTQKFGQE